MFLDCLRFHCASVLVVPVVPLTETLFHLNMRVRAVETRNYFYQLLTSLFHSVAMAVAAAAVTTRPFQGQAVPVVQQQQLQQEPKVELPAAAAAQAVAVAVLAAQAAPALELHVESLVLE
jgi:hypothetical protein